VRIPDAFAFRVVADARHLVWMTGPVEEEKVQSAMVQRDLRTERTTTLARGVDVAYGLVSTAKWVVYARTGTDGATRLLAVRHDGSGAFELSASLIAPLASRGELLAWVERTGGADRVIVRDMAVGKQWIAASMPRCVGGRCYRIETVTLADDGVVFTRVTTNPDASEIFRRAFVDSQPSRISIPGDPQPELLPSSAGALYYALDRGWFRWDFGMARPRRMPFATNPPAPLVAYEHGRWFALERRGCRYGLTTHRSGGPRSTLASPSRLMRLAKTQARGLCVQMGGLAWTGRQPLTSWGVLPSESAEEEEEDSLVGLVSVGAPLR
jgi:hypothetical protein